jgi:hypothetical protein
VLVLVPVACGQADRPDRLSSDGSSPLLLE